MQQFMLILKHLKNCKKVRMNSPLANKQKTKVLCAVFIGKSRRSVGCALHWQTSGECLLYTYICLVLLPFFTA
jgi:hypothetical protein